MTSGQMKMHRNDRRTLMADPITFSLEEQRIGGEISDERYVFVPGVKKYDCAPSH